MSHDLKECEGTWYCGVTQNLIMDIGIQYSSRWVFVKITNFEKKISLSNILKRKTLHSKRNYERLQLLELSRTITSFFYYDSFFQTRNLKYFLLKNQNKYIE